MPHDPPHRPGRAIADEAAVNGLSLFTGIGGLDLALSPWVTPVAYCEIDRYAQAVLLSRMADGSLPDAPIWPDVRTLPVQDLPEIDIVYGGFPCQDLSVAGTRKGLEGSRSGLVFDMLKLIDELRPRSRAQEGEEMTTPESPALRSEKEAREIVVAYQAMYYGDGQAPKLGWLEQTIREALTCVRREALREAATVAEDHVKSYVHLYEMGKKKFPEDDHKDCLYRQWASEEIAEQIRALASNGEAHDNG